jgi:hypothetical protein
MTKHVTLQVAILVVTLAIVLPLGFSIHSTSVTNSVNTISTSGRAIVFDLQRGQTVTGWLNYYTSEPNIQGSWYRVVDPNGNGLNELNSEGVYLDAEGNHGTFTFIAKIAGEWSIEVSTSSKPYGGNLYYSYSINSPPILGLDRVMLIGIVVVVGVILELILFESNNIQLKKLIYQSRN